MIIIWPQALLYRLAVTDLECLAVWGRLETVIDNSDKLDNPRWPVAFVLWFSRGFSS